MAPLYETYWTNAWVKVFPTRLVFSMSIARNEINLSLSQIASIELGIWGRFTPMIIETMGGKRYELWVKDKKKLRDEIYKAQDAMASKEADNYGKN